MVGGQWINQLLSSTVVCLAFPLYLNRHKIVKYFKTIFVSVFTAVILNFSLIYFSLKLLGYGREDIVTLLPVRLQQRSVFKCHISSVARIQLRFSLSSQRAC